MQQSVKFLERSKRMAKLAPSLDSLSRTAVSIRAKNKVLQSQGGPPPALVKKLLQDPRSEIQQAQGWKPLTLGSVLQPAVS